MVIRQGDVFWVDIGEPSGSGPGLLHPHVVVQNDLFNQSRVGTVVVCSLTSNLKRAEARGNVLLDVGEANLPKPSVAVISQLFTVDKDDLVEWIGTLSPARVEQIVEGIHLLLEPRELDEPSRPIRN
ncbi:MAG TPA: type II toxin-antitoxin system PemK/MazF family toxin [Thermoanaerobaculia bacterium]|nr:type II toxin-antitoxin system PemK/MazF family toxin [Thermoanaerobaculia bacterium]